MNKSRNLIDGIILVALLACCQGNSLAASRTEVAGDVLQIAIPASGFGATFCLDDEQGRMQFYKSFLATVVATHALKAVVHKPRPDGSDNKSFPSGHTSSAFQGAAFIHLRYGLKYGIPAYLAATYVAYSRVATNHHYVIDTVGGAAIGILSNMYFTTPYKDVKLAVLADDGAYGLRLQAKW